MGVSENVDEENHTTEYSVNKGQDKGHRARADVYDSHNAAVYTPRIDPFSLFCALVERQRHLLRAHLVGAALDNYICAAGGYAGGDERHGDVGLQEWRGAQFPTWDLERSEAS